MYSPRLVFTNLIRAQNNFYVVLAAADTAEKKCYNNKCGFYAKKFHTSVLPKIPLLSKSKFFFPLLNGISIFMVSKPRQFEETLLQLTPFNYAELRENGAHAGEF
jgi:hypothetical protein